jgi:anti-anti-sigma regulatory factor
MDPVVVRAPNELGADSRAAFREEAVRALASLGDAPPHLPLIIDFTHTQRVDSAGLGALITVQMRAAEGRRPVALRRVSEEVRYLLLMTRLDDRFEFLDD